MFRLLLEQAPVFGQANRTLNSLDSSGRASQGWQRCSRPPRRSRAHQPWPFTPAAGSSLCGGSPLGGSEAPGHPWPPCVPTKAPTQSFPAPGCTVKIQQRRMRPRALGQPRHPEKSRTHEQPPSPKHHCQPLAQSPSLQETHLPLPQPSSLSVIPASLCPPLCGRGLLCCLRPPAPLCHFVPGPPLVAGPGGAHTMVAWLRCYRCVWGLPGLRVPQIPQIQLFGSCWPAVNPLVPSASPSHHTCPCCPTAGGWIPSSSWAGVGALIWQRGPGCDPRAFITTGKGESWPGHAP